MDQAKCFIGFEKFRAEKKYKGWHYYYDTVWYNSRNIPMNHVHNLVKKWLQPVWFLGNAAKYQQVGSFWI